MSERGPSDPELDDVPEAVVQGHDRRISIVWLIPLVAVLVGAFVAWRALSERGPLVTITFQTAEGVEAGKTKVKHKDVEIGLVEKVSLTKDLAAVEVQARMVRGAEDYLTDRTRFWIEKARIAGGQVSGLQTLLSGAYIGIDPVREGKHVTKFVGLDEPPVVTMDRPGKQFVLRSYRAGSIDAGTPVFFRRIRVGQVLSSKLDPSGEFVEVRVFVDAPNDARVVKETRWWNASGFDVTVNADGVRVDSQSLVSILVGGIAFDTPPAAKNEPAPPDNVFPLYENREAANEQWYWEKVYYLLYFDQSVRGLAAGAPVEFRGIPIGRVIDVRLEYDPARRWFRVPVMVEIEPGRIGGRPESGVAPMTHRENVDRLVEGGLRAQLRTGNLLTGQLVVALDMHPEAKPAAVDWTQQPPVMPTIPTPLEEITSSAARLAQKLEKLPLDEIAKDLRKALADLQVTLQESKRTLSNAGDLVDPTSPVVESLQRTLIELQEAARSLGVAADQFDQEPESVIFGKEGAQ